ncbi:protein translocase subunit SecDF [Pollutibacter soli]|uniref:protein translocase subunit SecDF n=1 Tax=Pollutibacter soli TaxID=3034157 RepID=UPI0030141709
MQFKGLVRFFAAALILISLYQLHFTWVVRSHEKKMEGKAKAFVNSNYATATAEEKDTEYKRRLKRLLDSTREETVTYGTTGAISYQKAKEQELNLGLDLQGGMSVTLEVELEDMLRSLSNNAKDPGLNKALATADQRKANSDADFITLFAQAYKEQNPTARLASIFAGTGQRNIKIEDNDNSVITKLRASAEGAISNTYNVLLKRIDQFGVAQPNIQLDKNKGIITVELPGVKDDPERVRKYLQATANLQFSEVYNLGELDKPFTDAEKALQDYYSGVKKVVDTAAKPVVNAPAAPAVDEDTTKTLTINDLAKKDTSKSAADTTAASAQNAYSFFRIFQPVPPQQGPNGQLSFAPYLGFIAARDTATFNSYMSIDAVRNQFPSNVKFVYGVAEKNDKGVKSDVVTVYALKMPEGSAKARLEGDGVQQASQDYDDKGRPSIKMLMTKQGERIWGEMTTENVGKPIAIVLDNLVYSAPNVINPITSGTSEISGSFTIQEAQDLANILQSGKLPAPAKIVQEQVVGPTLGAAAVKGGSMAFIISFFVIFILMLVYYNTSGWVANISLVLNLLFTVGVLSALGATLTAPGIAGLVLTIGMAVDTNVIIFERIKDELTKGKSYQLAVAEGYRRSLPPVLDGHITTLLTALILFYFGLGPVLGFATTQILGILLSLFCGILISRLITDFWTNKNRHFKYFTNVSTRIFKHAAYKFIEYRKIAYVISVVVLILGVGSLFNGFDEGVEYKGGRSYTVKFDKPVNTEQITKELDKSFEGQNTIVKTVGDNKTLNITTSYLIEQNSRTADSTVELALFNGLKSVLPANSSIADFRRENKQSSQTVLPSISDDLKKGAVKATIFALIAIFLYILLRFRDWRYSVGTFVALLHDVFVTLAVFSFLRGIVPFPLEIDQHFIAAILTVIGFSMNDTVIVFDRIRENTSIMKGASKTEIINKSINETLSRTIMTSLTVFLTILILFIFGGEATRGFSFAMLIGVITGCYSSIFVAAPILVDLAKDKPLGKEEAHVAKANPKSKPALAK